MTNTPYSRRRWIRRFGISIGGAMPFLILQFAYILDPEWWIHNFFDTGAMFGAVVTLFICWCAYCLLEFVWRFITDEPKIPVFGLAGALLLFAFFLPGMFVTPIAKHILPVGQIDQAVVWTTTKPNHHIVLVLEGQGTMHRYRFTSAKVVDLNEDISQNFPLYDVLTIDLKSHESQSSNASLYEALLEGMVKKNAQLAEEELAPIAQDVCDIIDAINNGQTVTTDFGQVEEISFDIEEGKRERFGGLIWMLFVCVGFQAVGYFTIGRGTEIATLSSMKTRFRQIFKPRFSVRTILILATLISAYLGFWSITAQFGQKDVTSELMSQAVQNSGAVDANPFRTGVHGQVHPWHFIESSTPLPFVVWVEWNYSTSDSRGEGGSAYYIWCFGLKRRVQIYDDYFWDYNL